MSKVLLIGPKRTGGITSVIDTYVQNGINAEFMPSYKFSNVIACIAYYILFFDLLFLRLIFDKSIKILHIHSASNGSFYRKAFIVFLGKFFGKKIIFHIHGAEFHLFYKKSNTFIKTLIKYTLCESDKVIALSQKWKNEISKIVPNKEIDVVYNPITIKTISAKKNSTTNFLFMGRICKRKGVYEIVDAAKILQDKDFKIFLYGDGDKKEIQKLITENNLQNKTIINAWIKGTEKEMAFQNADVLLLPSFNEGMPISIMEAMAHGLAIIASDAGGICEQVEDGQSGFIIEAGNSQNLAQKMDLLISNKNTIKKMGEKGYKIASEKFAAKKIIPELNQLYDKLS